MKRSLWKDLKEYGESDYYPFHMPGHKRNPAAGPLAGLYRYDITEIDGFDNLHAPEGIIREAQEYAAGLYHSEETYFLVNGSTSGILSAVSAAACRGGSLIIARNCHKAVYHAAFLNHLKVDYLYPKLIEGFGIADGISALQVREKLKEMTGEKNLPLTKAGSLVAGIVLTSPTYDGILSDVEGIVEEAHAYGIPVIVDQAHGAHFGFHPGFPQSAAVQGADLVIHSLHKTLPAPTQTALIHRNGGLIRKELLIKYLRIYQSSSPSYLLMAGIDSCMELMEKEGKERLEELLRHRNAFMEQVKDLKHIRIYPACRMNKTEGKKWEPGQQEPGKLVISVRGTPMTGKRLYSILRERYHLQFEMCAIDYAGAVLSLMDREEGFARLAKALCEIDGTKELWSRAEQGTGKGTEERTGPGLQTGVCPQVVMRLDQAFTAPYQLVPLQQAKGETAADFVNLYPPGIPILAPGERIDERIIHLLEDHLRAGFEVQGIDEEKRVKAVKLQ